MTIEKMATVLAVDDVAASVASWSVLLGVAPTFQDGERWAQFDVANGRLALACASEAPHGSGVMVKVADLDTTHALLAAQGYAPETIKTGGHERRFAVNANGAAVIFYGPR